MKNPVTRKLTVFCAVLVLATTAPIDLLADESLFRVADEAAVAGRLDDMQAAYEKILVTDPKSMRALNGRAAALAWQGNYAAAQSAYLQALAVDPKNLDAQIGIGYAYAWSGAYTRAHMHFQRALRIDRKNISARKGIAYAYQWAGESELALESLEIAQSVSGPDPEIEEAVGRVKLTLGHSRDAAAHFNRALEMDPTRRSARLGRRSAYTAAPMLAVTSRFGSTSGAGTGLRALEVAHWAGKDTRLAIRYDNSLGLDNASISDRGDDAPGYFATVQQNFGNRWTLGAELGRRDFAIGDQNIVGLQVGYDSPVGVVRVGSQLGRHSAGHTDRLVFGSLNFPVATGWRLEPTMYVSQTGGASDDEWRAVVHAEYEPQSYWKAGGFIGAGDISAADAAFEGSTSVAGVWGRFLLADRHTLHLLLRREGTPTADFTAVELGFTYRLPGN